MTKKKAGGKQSFLNRPRFESRLPPCCAGGQPSIYADPDDGGYREYGTRAPRKGTDWPYYLHERAFFHSIGIHDDEYIAERLGVSWNTFEVGLTRAGLTAHKGLKDGVDKRTINKGFFRGGSNG